MYVGKKAYKTTGEDSVVYLSTGWKESEFNIVGDGGGSEADFNSGSSITVKSAVTNGTTNAPICASNAGTTGETNNLNLGSCTGDGRLETLYQVHRVELRRSYRRMSVDHE